MKTDSPSPYENSKTDAPKLFGRIIYEMFHAVHLVTEKLQITGKIIR